MKTLINKSNLIIIFLFTVFVYILQSIVFSDQLKFGFRDGDWWILYEYKKLGALSLDHIIETWKRHGVYTYQVYYTGILEGFVGLDFQKLHQFTHYAKFLATLSIFPLVYFLTRNKLTAFLTTLIYSVAYPTAGAMFMFVTGGYFLAIFSMSLFLICYIFSIRNPHNSLKFLFLALGLLIITLLLNTERMFGLIPLILMVEAFIWWRNRFSRDSLSKSFYRMSVLILPFIFFYVVYTIWIKAGVYQYRFVEGFFPEAVKRFEAILDGNWQLVLYPFASFGSMFLFGDYWQVLGVIKVGSPSTFLFNFIKEPFLIFSLTTIFLMFLISKKPQKLILGILIPVFIFGLLIFILARNWMNIDPAVRIHFDINVLGIPALFGFFIIVLCCAFLFTWLREKDDLNKSYLLPLFLGPLVSFLFILLTWIPSDIQLAFMGPQRYLTAPSIGSSVFLGGLTVLIFTKLKKVRIIKNFAWISLLVVVPIILINADIVKDFFNYELNFVGMNGAEQTRMKNKFWSIAPKISTKEPSLFYFDESADHKNGYFNESTVLAGFDDWIRFDHGKNILERPTAGMIRSNIHCSERIHKSCLDILKESFQIKDEEKGFFYKDTFNNSPPKFYKLSNFYAMRFISRDLWDIKQEVLEELNINE